jgi:hypothetical protein
MKQAVIIHIFALRIFFSGRVEIEDVQAILFITIVYVFILQEQFCTCDKMELYIGILVTVYVLISTSKQKMIFTL